MAKLAKSSFAIFPGTFNPIHIGHLSIAESALLLPNVSDVHFIISPLPPHKPPDQYELIETGHRKKLLELALKDQPHFQLDERELRRSGPSFTADTVCEVREAYALSSETALQVILGFDAFLTLPSWQRSDELKEHCHFLLAPRPHTEIAELPDYYDDSSYELLDSPLLAVSSSAIRARKRGQRAYRYLLTEPVYEYFQSLS